ncbi:hypothetical protein ABT026_21245 [Streptomyces sp. NPDC002734]
MTRLDEGTVPLAALWFPHGAAGVVLLVIAFAAIVAGVFMGRRGGR